MTNGNWQRRWQPLLDQWVIIAARSAVRPWSGALSNEQSDSVPEHDPECYLCPKVKRAGGSTNPDYSGAFAFDNDFPSLSFDAPDVNPSDSNSTLNKIAAAHGICRVLCWSEKHDATLASLPQSAMRKVARLWQSEYQQLSNNPNIGNVLMFENKGVEIGVSNLHPHGQIYATSFLTDSAEKIRQSQVNYATENKGASLLVDLLNDEHTQSHLVVDTGKYFSTIVPFAARFAYETWIIPNKHIRSLSDMNDDQLDDLADLYQRQVRRYDVLFQRSAPNITLLHNAPCNEEEVQLNKHWCFHIAFHPPLRDAEKLKYLAGFESGANNIINPVQPESAAEQLRAASPENWQS